MFNFLSQVEKECASTGPDVSSAADAVLADCSLDELRLLAKFGLICSARFYYRCYRLINDAFLKHVTDND